MVPLDGVTEAFLPRPKPVVFDAVGADAGPVPVGVQPKRVDRGFVEEVDRAVSRIGIDGGPRAP